MDIRKTIQNGDFPYRRLASAKHIASIVQSFLDNVLVWRNPKALPESSVQMVLG